MCHFQVTISIKVFGIDKDLLYKIYEDVVLIRVVQ